LETNGRICNKVKIHFSEIEHEYNYLKNIENIKSEKYKRAGFKRLKARQTWNTRDYCANCSPIDKRMRQYRY